MELSAEDSFKDTDPDISILVGTMKILDITSDKPKGPGSQQEGKLKSPLKTQKSSPKADRTTDVAPDKSLNIVKLSSPVKPVIPKLNLGQVTSDVEIGDISGDAKREANMRRQLDDFEGV